jgi:hypothetical protein
VCHAAAAVYARLIASSKKKGWRHLSHPQALSKIQFPLHPEVGRLMSSGMPAVHRKDDRVGFESVAGSADRNLIVT